MFRVLANLRLATKLILPLAVIALVTAGIVWQARSGLADLAATMHRLVDRAAMRVVAVLTIEDQLNAASVNEKDFMLDTSLKETDTLRANHTRALAEARRWADRLAAISDTAESRTAAQEIKAAIAAFAAPSDRVVSLAAAGQFDNAWAISSGAAQTARTQATTLVQAQLAADLREMAADKRQAAALAQATGRRVMLVSVLGLLVAFGLLGAVLRYLVTQPLGAMTAAMSRLAEGDLSVTVDGAERRDEVGSLARSLTVFRENAVAARRAEAEAEAERRRAGEAARAAVNRVAAEFEASVGEVVRGVASAATEMQSAAQSMSGTANAAGQRAHSVATAAGQATTNVNSVAAAAEELSSSIAEIARQVTRASGIARAAVQEAERANASVLELTQEAQSISEVVQMIQGIARQTNLLALNATIEAARAGDTGKGFAVVASEVKSLAGQTAKATEEIRTQIASVQQTTQNVVGVIATIGGTIERLDGIAAAIAAAVEQQGAATREIAGSVAQAAQGTGEVSDTISGVTQAAGEVGAASGKVLASASDLTRQADVLRTQVSRFLASIREAA